MPAPPQAIDRRELPPPRRRWRVMYWTPWTITKPWLPRWIHGSDEYHNYSWAVIAPLVGAVCVFRNQFSPIEGYEHLNLWTRNEGWEGLYVIGCPICAEIYETERDGPLDGVPDRSGPA